VIVALEDEITGARTRTVTDLFHKALDLVLGFRDSGVCLSLDGRLFGELAAHGAGTTRKCGLRRDGVRGHKLWGLNLQRKKQVSIWRGRISAVYEGAYIVDVDGFTIDGDRKFIALALFSIGKAIHISDASLAGCGMKGARQLRQDRWRLQIHDW
jgi:hypothetical protein